MKQTVKLQPFVGRWDFLWRLDADFGVPLSRRKNNHLIQKLVNSCDEVLAVPGLVGHVTEELEGRADESGSLAQADRNQEVGL